MDEQFIRDRITQLRISAKKSEREMSIDLGHSGSYIHSIVSGRTAPSLREFLYICEYLQVTPEEFFRPNEELSASNGLPSCRYENLTMKMSLCFPN